ncbi:unnamed protein product, partial [marine sediment metagenome]
GDAPHTMVQQDKENVKMGKYVYIRFIRWRNKALELGSEYWKNTWMPKHDELCVKHGVKLLKRGGVYGIQYHSAFIYETDKPLAEYIEFANDLGNIHEERLIDLTETITVV